MLTWRLASVGVWLNFGTETAGRGRVSITKRHDAEEKEQDLFFFDVLLSTKHWKREKGNNNKDRQEIPAVKKNRGLASGVIVGVLF